MAEIPISGGTRYENKGYSVVVDYEGLIIVKPGDSLSKYSMAIHGDFKHINKFRRAEKKHYKRGRFYEHSTHYSEIVNKDIIYVGELIVHDPSTPKFRCLTCT